MWAGLVVAIVCVGAWLFSGRYVCTLNPGGGLFLQARLGMIAVGRTPYMPAEGRPWVRVYRSESYRLLFEFHAQCYSARDWQCSAPLPALVPLALLPGFIAWRRARVAQRNAGRALCRGCGYDRAGLALLAPCPECGRTPAAALAMRRWRLGLVATCVCGPAAVVSLALWVGAAGSHEWALPGGRSIALAACRVSYRADAAAATMPAGYQFFSAPGEGVFSGAASGGSARPAPTASMSPLLVAGGSMLGLVLAWWPTMRARGRERRVGTQG